MSVGGKTVTTASTGGLQEPNVTHPNTIAIHFCLGLLDDSFLNEEYFPSEEEMDFRNCTDVLDTCGSGFDGCAGLSKEKPVTAAVQGFCVGSGIETTTQDETSVNVTESGSNTTFLSTIVTDIGDSTILRLTTTDMAVELTTTESLATEMEISDTNPTTEEITSNSDLSTEDTTYDPITAHTTETPERNIFSCNRSCNCRCKCIKTIYITLENWTILQEQKARWISAILDDLSLNKSSFSSTRRRYNSAEDTRKSVATIGSLGVIVLVIVLLGILLLDLSALVSYVRILTRTLGNVFHR